MDYSGPRSFWSFTRISKTHQNHSVPTWMSQEVRKWLVNGVLLMNGVSWCCILTYLVLTSWDIQIIPNSTKGKQIAVPGKKQTVTSFPGTSWVFTSHSRKSRSLGSWTGYEGYLYIPDPKWSMYRTSNTSWWLNHPSEKYARQVAMDHFPKDEH